MPTAILVDGGYFLKRYRALIRDANSRDPRQVAKNLFAWALLHLEDKDAGKRELYRIFYYDCPPILKKAHNPVTKRSIDFSKTPEAQFRLGLHRELVKLRKVALRLGRLADSSSWAIRPERLKQLLSGKITVSSLLEGDVFYEVRRKGVDMRIGLDIAALAFKRQVDQIILIAGDSDFVPAAKLARREGIDFILDPMWGSLPADLHEHVDGLRSTCPRPAQRPEFDMNV
ncbi:MAG: NYN domain-containing protein [Bryobacterales bacterium]|nr:NYN domain-containing protein [Bryobacterales bacterium]